MSKRKYKPKLDFIESNISPSFDDLLWFSGRTSDDIIQLAIMNKLICACYLKSTPIQSSVYFHQKTIIHA